ncbi:hypothetical protein ACFU6S_32730 [Streptomyces sp. NPDC057456]|uniref:hypothetical protein n=1 Tax=Streptomyces sp. NPDC057456 TaxID=3346139 RepID=UPI0036B6DBD4
MPTPALCPGVCNTAWRRAERARITTKTGHDVPVTWGTPIHCPGCVARAHRQLGELPELLTAVAEEPLYGQRGAPSASSHSAPTDTTPWPGQAARLLVDHIAGGLAETAAELHRLHHGRELPIRPPGLREGTWIENSVRLLVADLNWLMQEHPLAHESHEPLHRGRGIIPSGNPAAQISHWHNAATRFTRRDKAPESRRLAPCKRCGGPWLAESRDLRLIDDEPYIECQDPNCQALYRPDEYRQHVKELTGQETARRRQAEQSVDDAPEKPAA